MQSSSPLALVEEEEENETSDRRGAGKGMARQEEHEGARREEEEQEEDLPVFKEVFQATADLTVEHVKFLSSESSEQAMSRRMCDLIERLTVASSFSSSLVKKLRAAELTVSSLRQEAASGGVMESKKRMEEVRRTLRKLKEEKEELVLEVLRGQASLECEKKKRREMERKLKKARTEVSSLKSPWKAGGGRGAGGGRLRDSPPRSLPHSSFRSPVFLCSGTGSSFQQDSKDVLTPYISAEDYCMIDLIPSLAGDLLLDPRLPSCPAACKQTVRWRGEKGSCKGGRRR